MYSSQDVAIRIRELAKIQKMPLQKMWSELGLSPATLGNFKTSMPNAGMLARIADYLDCSMDYLMGRTDEKDVKR